MVKVKLFANFREVAGRREVDVDAENLIELLEKLKNEFPEFEKLYGYAIIMVNGKRIENIDLKLGSEDVVALLPPVSGG